MKKFFTLVFLMFFFVSAIIAQQKTISGTVTDANSIALPGVTVQVKGTNNGTTTDLDGKYTISAEGGSLIFSYVGFDKQEIAIGNQTTINVSLTEDVKQLSEVVVVGYGTQKKKDITTSVAVVGEDAIKDRPLVSAVEALQGKAAGVQVVQPSGKPGSELSVRVRGATSVIAGNEPLYVVDGVPTTDIRGINPNDITSMSVLKDASSASIYGARAANGVVLITTKRGTENEPQISFNTYYGVSDLRKTIEVLNTKRYRELMEEIIPGGLDPTQTAFNSWPDIVFGTGNTQSYQLSYTNGNNKASQYISIGYLSDQGIVKPARFDRYSFRLNLDNKVKPWLKLGTSFSLVHLSTKDTPDNASSGRGGVIMSALNTPPFLSVYKNDGSGQFDPNPFQPSWENPIAYMEGPDQEAIDNHLFGNIFAEATLLKDFTYITRLGIDINQHQWDYYLDPFRTTYGRNTNGLGSSDKNNATTVLWENTLGYKKKINSHNVTALVGSSIQRYKSNDSYITGSDFPEDVSVQTLNAANIISANTWVEEWALASFFGRATYDYQGR